jgi:hypothetical protein
VYQTALHSDPKSYVIFWSFFAGMQYGANTYTTVTDSNTDEISKKEAETKMDVVISKLNVKSGSSGVVRVSDIKTERSLETDLYTDVNGVGAPPNNVNEIWSFLDKLGELMKEKKGTVISYDLYPISNLRKLYQSTVKSETREVGRDTSLLITRLYDLINRIWNEMELYTEYVHEYNNYLPIDYVIRYNNYTEAWRHKKAMLEGTLRTAIVQYRSKLVEEASLLDAHDRLQDHCALFRFVSVKRAFRTDFKEIEQSIDIFNTFNSGGVTYLPHRTALDELKQRGKTFIVLFFRREFIAKDLEDWSILTKIMTGYKQMWLDFNNPPKYVQDCDLHATDCNRAKGNKILKYENGKLQGEGDYMCAISKSVRSWIGHSLFGTSWFMYDESPITKPCRTPRTFYAAWLFARHKDVEYIV